MRIAKTTILNPDKDTNSQLQSLNSDLDKLYLAVQGRIRFGDGTDGTTENIYGQFQVIADTGSANTNFSVTHTLGATPVGYLVTKISNAGVIYLGTDAWTSTTISLKSSAANSAVTIFILG